MSRRIVVTGLGAVSPNGIGKENFWDNTCKGVSGIRRILSFNPSDLSCQIAGEVQDFEPEAYYSKADLKKLPRAIPMAVAASKEALDDGGIDLSRFEEEDFERLGIIVGSGGAGFDFSERQFEIYFSGQKNKISPYAISNSLVGMLCRSGIVTERVPRSGIGLQEVSLYTDGSRVFHFPLTLCGCLFRLPGLFRGR